MSTTGQVLQRSYGDQESVNINKSLVTNILCVVVTIVGYFLPENLGHQQVLNIGLFALSGAITNWLAVHMLFEKVPFLYGSGVIPSRFQEFKTSIYTLIMSQFFSHENLEKFFESYENDAADKINLDGLINTIDYNTMFDKLKAVIMESSFSGMLMMVGGEKALEPMRAPFSVKMKETFKELTDHDHIQKALHEQLFKGQLKDEILKKVDGIVKQRLEELTPQKVKEIVQEMIQKHLGWLVVWGGVFGGIIGLLASLI